MARRRRKSGRRRSRRKGMSEGQSFMSAGGRRSRKRGRRRKRGFLSETFSTQSVKNTGKSIFGGATGGVLANIINRFEMGGLMRAGVNLGASFVAGAAFDMPNVAAGISGAYAMLLTQQIADGTLKEEYDYADPNVLSEYPQYMDEDGNGMYLADDGNLYYLEEGSEGAYALADGGIYANYINPANY